MANENKGSRKKRTSKGASRGNLSPMPMKKKAGSKKAGSRKYGSKSPSAKAYAEKHFPHSNDGRGSDGAKKNAKSGAAKKRYPSKKKVITSNRTKGFAGGKRPYDYSAYEKEDATIEYMKRLFDNREFKVKHKELQRYWRYYELLREMNAELDLTRIMGIEATVLKHFIDCAIVADIHELKGPVLDIGSGPGFPGAPIAIRNPEVPIILAESRGKRVKFLEILKKELKLDNVTIYPRSVTEESRIEASSIVTRAVEKIPATLKRVLPFIQSGGEVVFMKGPSCGQEITDAQQYFKGVYTMTADYKYDLPHTNQNRRLVVFTKRESREKL